MPQTHLQKSQILLVFSINKRLLLHFRFGTSELLSFLSLDGFIELVPLQSP